MVSHMTSQIYSILTVFQFTPLTLLSRVLHLGARSNLPDSDFAGLLTSKQGSLDNWLVRSGLGRGNLHFCFS